MLSRTKTVAQPTPAGIIARNWKRFGCLTTLFAITTICLVLAMPVGLSFRWIQDYLTFEPLRDERICLIPFLVTVLFIPSRVGPWIRYSFGGRSGNRRFGRRVIPENIAYLQYDLRRWMMVLLGAQFVSLAVAFWGLFDADGYLGMIRSFHWLILVPLAFGVFGLVFSYFGKLLFLHTRGRKKGVWTVNKRRGIPLRDFIWKWDTTTRQIFDRCRISRRVAGAFAAVTLLSAGCFAAMGCLGSFFAAHYGVAVAINAFSIPATAWFWPTPKRLVRWTADIIDNAP